MQPNAQTMPGEMLSPSAANTYLSCQARWWFKYGLSLPDPASGGAVRGSAVHKTVEYALRAKMAGVVLEQGAVTDAWDAAWDDAAEGAEFLTSDDIEALKTTGAKLAQKYIAEAVPAIEPAAVELPVTGEIGGVRVRGIADIVTADGLVIDIKTSSRKPSGISADHALQLATYDALVPEASGARIDTLVGTKDVQLIQIEHTPGEAGRKLVERIYPMVAEGIAGGLFLPNRSGVLCSRRHCPYADACTTEFGGQVE